MSAKQKQNGVSGQISWKLMCGIKGTLHAALNAPALSEAGPRWGGVWVCACVRVCVRAGVCVWVGMGGGGGAEGKCPPNRNMAYWGKGDTACHSERTCSF